MCSFTFLLAPKDLLLSSTPIVLFDEAIMANMIYRSPETTKRDRCYSLTAAPAALPSSCPTFPMTTCILAESLQAITVNLEKKTKPHGHATLPASAASVRFTICDMATSVPFSTHKHTNNTTILLDRLTKPFELLDQA
jgi:hypothetical protein